MNICMSGMPGRTALSETHGVCCYLNDEGAPDVEWGGAKG